MARCGKIIYPSKRDAFKAQRVMVNKRKRNLGCYYCYVCQGYHLGRHGGTLWKEGIYNRRREKAKRGVD